MEKSTRTEKEFETNELDILDLELQLKELDYLSDLSDQELEFTRQSIEKEIDSRKGN